MGVSCVYISVHSPSAVSTVTLLEDWWPAKSGQYWVGGIPISAQNHPPCVSKIFGMGVSFDNNDRIYNLLYAYLK